jgi:hypothetical protein
MDDNQVHHGYTAYPSQTNDGLPSTPSLAPSSANDSVNYRVGFVDAIRAHSLMISYLSGMLSCTVFAGNHLLGLFGDVIFVMG